MRDATAMILGLDAANIKVTPSEIGGGFGGKIPVYLEPLAVVLARMTQRPVKMVMTRDEVFRASGPTSATKIRMKMGAKKDGTIVAASASLYYEAGAYRGSPSGAGAMCALAPYNIPNFFVEAYDVVVNKPKVAAYRAPGSPMAALATESLIDEIARTLGIDLVEIRLKNAVAEGDRAPYGPPYGPIGFKAVLDAVRNSDHWKSPMATGHGRGLACGFWFNAGMSSSATVTLGADGSAAVVTGNPDIGGTRAAQAHDGVRGTGHSGGADQTDRGRHRHGGLHGNHGREPRLLRHGHGGHRGVARRSRATAGAGRDRSGACRSKRRGGRTARSCP